MGGVGLAHLWWGWSLELPLVAAAVAALAFFAGLMARAPRRHTRHASAFAGSVAIVLVALASPIDHLGECCLFWLHMVQHVLLLLVAPPLAALGLSGLLPAGPLRGGRWTMALTGPRPALALMLLNLYLWHLPAAYQAALRIRVLHDLEHLLFLTTGMLFWRHVVGPPSPFKFFYLLGGTLAMMPLGLILLAAPEPLYPLYLQWGGPLRWTPLFDQRVAALVMLLGGGTVLAVTLYTGLAWLSRPERTDGAL